MQILQCLLVIEGVPFGLSLGKIGESKLGNVRNYTCQRDQETFDLTSFAVTRSPSQSTRGIILRMNSGWKSSSSSSSSASWKWRGNDADDVLHPLTAQVKKFAVTNFIVFVSQSDRTLE
jgi:hypothetical protein